MRISRKIMHNKSPDLQLRPDDILYIPNSTAKMLERWGWDQRLGSEQA